ncbi:hypothetical protein OK016_18715 [Vibrio chagasii]|nr:hypothetical protein [Vibrio chagasii]
MEEQQISSVLKLETAVKPAGYCHNQRSVCWVKKSQRSVRCKCIKTLRYDNTNCAYKILNQQLNIIDHPLKPEQWYQRR